MEILREESIIQTTNPLILMVDVGGRPTEWVDWQKAAGHYISEKVAWTVGDPAIVLHGGINHSGERSILELHPIISVSGARPGKHTRTKVSLNNTTLFQRDRHTCMYCGATLHKSLLSRDHVVPRGVGGSDDWENVVTACKPCNHRKGCRTPEQASMKLLALPYVPSYVEGLILSNKRVLADQMEYLLAQQPKISRQMH